MMDTITLISAIPLAVAVAGFVAFLIWWGGISTMVEVNRRKVNKTIDRQEHDSELLHTIDGKLDVILRHNGYLKKDEDKKVDRTPHE